MIERWSKLMYQKLNKMKGIKVTYIVDSETMTDGEFQDQTEQNFIIDHQSLKSFIEDQVPRKAGQVIDWSYSSFEAIK